LLPVIFAKAQGVSVESCECTLPLDFIRESVWKKRDNEATWSNEVYWM